MNKDRRKRLNDAHQQLDEIKTAFEELLGKADDVKAAIEAIRDEEQEAFDNMSAGKQEGETGQAMEAVVEDLNSVIEFIETLSDVGFDEPLELIANAASS
jgi:cytochrome c556